MSTKLLKYFLYFEFYKIKKRRESYLRKKTKKKKYYFFCHGERKNNTRTL